MAIVKFLLFDDAGEIDCGGTIQIEKRVSVFLLLGLIV
jgi:hypothetical protein